MGEGGSGGGIGKIISRYEHSLDGGNGSVSGGGNSFLEHTQIGGEGRLVTDSGRDTSEKGGHFGASLGESEDVIDEQEHILVLFISEVLSNGESSESDTGSSTWGLVHLSVHEGGLGTVTLDINDLGFNHFVVEIVTFTGSLSDTSEHGVTTVSLGDIVNKLHDEDGLTDTGTTEESNLTSSGVGSKEINNLDTYMQTS
jgi:peptide chain release factor 1